VEVLLAGGVVEVCAVGSNPVAIKADRPQHADHLWIHVFGMEVEAFTRPRLEQIGELAHEPSVLKRTDHLGPCFFRGRMYTSRPGSDRSGLMCSDKGGPLRRGRPERIR